VGGVERTDVVGGRYRLDHLLGRGGMGEVWAGHDTILNRPVAVKMLRDDHGPDAPLLRQRLLAEARAAAAVRHPNLVSTFDAVSDDGTFALVMERLPGPSLADRLADGPLSAGEARTLALDVLGGLDAVHDAGLVHRDVKPANVLRSADGRWMLVDFGIAKNLATGADLTLTGTTVGTPAYLAPEQLEGRQATPSTDLWAVGVMLYEALSGRLPFPGDTPFAVAYSVQAESPEPLSAVLPDADPAISDTVERALRKSADDRFESASAMAASLRPHATPDPIPVVPPEGEAVVADAPTAPPTSRRVLALPLVLASCIVAVAMAVTLGGGDGGDPGPPTTTEAQDGSEGGSEPQPADGLPSDEATASSVPTRATGTGSRRPGAVTPGGGAAEDSSLTTETTTTAPPTGGPGTGPPTTAPPGTTPPTTTPPPTTAPPTTTPPTTDPPPVTLPPITLPDLPPGLGDLLPSSPGGPG